jgi:hypothetical protein
MRRANDRRKRERKKSVAELPGAKAMLERARDDPEYFARQSRGGVYYTKLVADPELLKGLFDGSISYRAGAQQLGCSPNTVPPILLRVVDELRKAEEQAGWVSPFQHTLLPADAKQQWKTSDDPETLLGIWVTRFFGFRDEMFTDDEGQLLVNKPFHHEWVTGMLRTFLEGGRRLILAPPRHGKTLLLEHFCIWMVGSFPNIRIIWLGANESMAKQRVSEIRGELTKNQKLIAGLLPPGDQWKPASKASGNWSGLSFTVGNRTLSETALGAPTMQAVGAGGVMNSRNSDFIVVDDFEDPKRNQNIMRQQDNRKWWAQTLGSRKTMKNAIFAIGSRQDADDVYGQAIKSSTWDVLVYQAHSPKCKADVDDIGAHTDCMLFPEINPYSWLVDQKNEFSDFGGEALWAMTYLNKAAHSGLVAYSRDEMEKCLDTTRGFGLSQLPAGLYLVGGLDPSPSNFQAAWLWGMDVATKRLFCVAINTIKVAGIEGAVAIIKEWFDAYQLRRWVIEQNGWQSSIIKDQALRDYKHENGIIIDGHETQGANKWDPKYGVQQQGIPTLLRPAPSVKCRCLTATPNPKNMWTIS